MKSFEFTLHISGISIKTDEDLLKVSEKIYGNHSDGAFVCAEDESLYIEYEREADSIEAAIMTAKKEIEALEGYTLKVTSIN